VSVSRITAKDWPVSVKLGVLIAITNGKNPLIFDGD